MGAKFFGEFMGTLVLILLGNGVVANVSLRHSKAEGAGWTAIAAGWAFAVMAGSFTATACGSPDSHLNPAMTLGMAIVSGDFSKVLPFLAAQLLGAVAGAIAVWLHFLPHWKVTDDANLKLACFSTSPAIPNFGANLLSEIIGTFVLVTVVGAIFSGKVAAGPVAGLGTVLSAAVIWAIGLSLGMPCCRSARRRDRTGGTLRFQSSDHCSVPCWPAFSCARRISKTTLVIFHFGINSYFAN